MERRCIEAKDDFYTTCSISSTHCKQTQTRVEVQVQLVRQAWHARWGLAQINTIFRHVHSRGRGQQLSLWRRPSQRTKMATKKTKTTPTDVDDLLAQFDDLGAQPPQRPVKTTTSRAAPKQTTTSAQSEQDLLAELGSLASQRPPSRPSTPSLKSSAVPTGNQSPKRPSTATPSLASRSSEERSAGAGGTARKSGESTRSFHQSFTPGTTTTEESPEPEPRPATAASSGGGWWGGILSTATAAVSQAQAALKEVQKNEEAQKWAEQVRGNVGALRGIGRYPIDSRILARYP